MSGRVFVTETALANLRNFAEESRPLETGGVLVGVLRDGEPWVTNVIQIRDRFRTSSRYMIPRDATPLAVELARDRDERVGYVGDWHSHPADLPASGIDQATLRRTAASRKRPPAPTIMIVVRDSDGGWKIEAMEDDGRASRPIELVMTGDLAAIEG